MARPMYPHELVDADFAWLISNFLEQHPEYYQVEVSCLPIVLLQGSLVPAAPDRALEDTGDDNSSTKGHASHSPLPGSDEPEGW